MHSRFFKSACRNQGSYGPDFFVMIFLDDFSFLESSYSLATCKWTAKKKFDMSDDASSVWAHVSDVVVVVPCKLPFGLEQVPPIDIAVHSRFWWPSSAQYSNTCTHMHALAQLSIKLACRSEHFVFLPRARNSSQSAFRDRAVNQPTRSTSQQQPASGQLVWILSLYPTQHYSPIQASNKLLLLWWFSFSKGNIFLKSPFVHEKIS